MCGWWGESCQTWTNTVWSPNSKQHQWYNMPGSSPFFITPSPASRYGYHSNTCPLDILFCWSETVTPCGMRTSLCDWANSCRYGIQLSLILSVSLLLTCCCCGACCPCCCHISTHLYSLETTQQFHPVISLLSCSNGWGPRSKDQRLQCCFYPVLSQLYPLASKSEKWTVTFCAVDRLYC